MMDRVNRIIRHPLWKGAVQQLEELEQDRVFCRHDINHFLHVGRMAYIENLEQSLDLSKEAIYAAALLHDIGRAMEYEGGIPHHEASAAMARGILTDCGFCQMEIETILDAITAHRNPDVAKGCGLAAILYRADKNSRNCFLCKAEAECRWSREQKNTFIKD